MRIPPHLRASRRGSQKPARGLPRRDQWLLTQSCTPRRSPRGKPGHTTPNCAMLGWGLFSHKGNREAADPRKAPPTQVLPKSSTGMTRAKTLPPPEPTNIKAASGPAVLCHLPASSKMPPGDSQSVSCHVTSLKLDCLLRTPHGPEFTASSLRIPHSLVTPKQT